ncbi:MAG: hypothetical protein AAFN50_12485, partial [Pseudomonadota bacterium]
MKATVFCGALLVANVNLARRVFTDDNDGKAKAAELAESITRDTAELQKQHGIKPGLAVVIIGEDPANVNLARRV